MAFGKKQILAAFLEKDNVKILAYEMSGKTVSRVFGGQVSFGEEALRDAFISDPVKFSSQVKMVLSQKPPLSEIPEGVLFVHPDKTFIKALPASESEAFVKSLPFFKEELVIQEPANLKDPASQGNYVAFEKKLVEDFERPFLESGKKIVSVNSSVILLVKKYPQTGKYILVLPFEKDVTVVVAQDGVALDLATFPKDVWINRMSEFRLGKGFSDVTNVFVVGNLDAGVADKIRNEQHLNVTELGGGDIYDLSVGASIDGGSSQGTMGGGKPKVSMPKLSMPHIPGQKYIFLLLAAIVGFVLVYLVLKNLLGVSLPGTGGSTGSLTPTPAPTSTATPEPTEVVGKPEDYTVVVLNGTTVAGEAGALGEQLTELGYDVTETANATSSGFVATRLRTVPDVPENIIEQLTTLLLETYSEVNEEPLASGSSDIEIIIGEKKE